MSPEVREEYMRFEDLIAYERRDAAKEAAEEATEKATQDTKKQSIYELLEDYGEIPDTLKEKLEGTKDLELLKKYHKLAAKVDSIDEFMRMVE